IVEDVIPRPTGKDGRRGRLVTDYHRVYGSFDINADAEILEEGAEVTPDDLLAPVTGDDEAAIEDLLREQQPHEGASPAIRDSNFSRRSNSITATAPGSVPSASPSEQREDQDRDEEKEASTSQ